MIQSQTSSCVKVRIDVEPNKVLHTSPVMLADVEKIFNTKYLKSTHYDEIMDDIISKRPIYDSNTLKQTSCGFEQNIINKMIKYEVCDNLIKFIDNKNRVKIIIRELQ